MCVMAILIQYANGVPGVKFSLDNPEITIGRALDNDISIDDEFVSKRHAIIQLVEDELTSTTHCILIDNESTNHTYVNNMEVSAHRLDENDKIFIGQNEFRFLPDSVPSTELGSTQNGFFADDAPGLMHESVTKAARTTTRLDNSTPRFSDVALDGYSVDELSGTHRFEVGVNSTDSTDEATSDSQNNKNSKRFSRRLTF